MNHTIRLYHDKADLVDHASEEIAKQSYVEETGLRDNIVVLGLSMDKGGLAARTFHNRKPGMPIPGALLQVIGGAAALEFAVDSAGMLDRLNALPMVDGDAFLFLGDGATFHRSLQPVTLELGLDLSQTEELDANERLATLAQLSSTLLENAALKGDGSGERLPDFDPALERTAEGTATAELLEGVHMPPIDSPLVDPATLSGSGTVTEIPADAAPEGTTAAETAPPTSETSGHAAAQHAPPSTQDEGNLRPLEDYARFADGSKIDEPGHADATDVAPEGTIAADATAEGSDTSETSAPAEGTTDAADAAPEGTTDATDAAPEGTTVAEATTEGTDTTDTSAPSQAAPAAPAKKRGR